MKNKANAFILILLLFNSCARDQQSLTASSGHPSAEMELGEAIHREILKTSSVYQEVELNSYVRSIGQKLASTAKRKKLNYQFIILNDDRIFATYAPGGFVYITTGFFRFLNNEIELAGILAHEIGLLQYKDPRLSKTKKAFDLLLRTGSYVGPAFGSIGAVSVLGLALIGAMTSGNKTLETRTRQADKHALRYLMECNYDPQGLVDPLRRMEDPASPFRAYLYDYVTSHPISAKRFEKLDREFAKLPLADKEFQSGRDVFLVKTNSVRSTFARK